MSWGRLARDVATMREESRAERRQAPQRRNDLVQIIDEHIAWQTTGLSPEGGMAVPAVYAAVRLIASTVDQLDLTAPGDPTWLREPRLYGCPYHQSALIQHIVTGMALHGHAYLLVERHGVSWKILPLDPDAVTVETVIDGRGVVSAVFRLVGDLIAPVPLPTARNGALWPEGGRWLLHIPYLITPKHPEGIGPLQATRETLTGYAAVERQAANLIDSGTHSGGILSSEQDITPDAAERYQSRWVANRRLGLIPVLGNGLTYRNDTISPHDAQWLESRQFNAGQVAQMFGIPPDYLGMAMSGGSSSLSYANSADNDRRFRRNCLEGFTGPIGDAFSTLLDVQRDQVQWDWAAWESASGRTEGGGGQTTT